MYRRSDPIGWPIFAQLDHDDPLVFTRARDTGQVDVEAPDPWPRPAPRVGDPLPEIESHSNYELDPPYRHARDELWNMLGVRREVDLRTPEEERASEPPVTRSGH